MTRHQTRQIMFNWGVIIVRAHVATHQVLRESVGGIHVATQQVLRESDIYSYLLAIFRV